jgi:hypothetical protein
MAVNCQQIHLDPATLAATGDDTDTHLAQTDTAINKKGVMSHSGSPKQVQIREVHSVSACLLRPEVPSENMHVINRRVEAHQAHTPGATAVATNELPDGAIPYRTGCMKTCTLGPAGAHV